MKKFALLLLALCSFYAVIGDIKYALASSTDFEWDGAKVISQRMDPYVYVNPKISLIAVQDKGDKRPHSFLHPYPPATYILLLPYALLPWTVAKISWILSNFIFTILIFYLIKVIFLKNTNRSTFFVFCGLVICSGSWKDCVGMGQHSLMVIFLFLLAYVASLKKMTLLAGVLLGASLVKFTMTIPLLFIFVLNLDIYPIFIAFLFQFFLTILSCFWLNLSPTHLISEYLHVALELYQNGFCDIYSIISALNNAGLVKQLDEISTFLSISTILLCCWILIKSKCKKDIASLSALSVAALLIVYHEECDYLLLIFPFAYAVGQPLSSRLKNSVYAVVGYLWFIMKFIEHFLIRQQWNRGFLFTRAFGFILLVFLLIQILSDVKNKKLNYRKNP